MHALLIQAIAKGVPALFGWAKERIQENSANSRSKSLSFHCPACNGNLSVPQPGDYSCCYCKMLVVISLCPSCDAPMISMRHGQFNCPTCKKIISI